MNTISYSKILKLDPEDNHRLFSLCGHFNEHIKLISQTLNVLIKQRGHVFYLSGEETAVKQTYQTLSDLYEETARHTDLSPERIHLYLQTVGKKTSGSSGQDADIRLKKSTISARGKTQNHYIDGISKHDIQFGIGPAGTGKTYLAVANAIHALETERVSRIILVRPIIEAGEKLGFLPGDIAQKVHPYLRPLYDALYEMMGLEKTSALMEKNVIELLPLAYMRGRSLNDSFIILDEGQNTSIEQMKMFLTRIGFNSKVVITGDPSQVDLAHRNLSGLSHAIRILQHIRNIGFTTFTTADIVRHPLVQSIVEAYEKDEARQNEK